MALVVKKFGFIAFLVGLLGFALALYLGRSFDYSTQELVGWIVMGMTAALVYFGIAYQRDTVNAGRITFSQAIKTGLVIAIFGGLGIAFADMIYTLFINPDFFDQYNEYALAIARKSGNQEAIDAIESQTKMFEGYSPIEMSIWGGLMMFVMTFGLGALIALLSSFILKKNN